MEAYPWRFDIEDWQCVKSTHSYEGTKYATDLLAVELNRRASASQTREPASQVKEPRHIIVHPGITLTEMVSSRLNLQWLTGALAWFIMMLVSRSTTRLTSPPGGLL